MLIGFQETPGSFEEQDLFEIELSENRKRMLEYYQQTGEILIQDEYQANDQIQRQSFLKKPEQEEIALSVIQEVDEQYLPSSSFARRSDAIQQNKQTQRQTFVDRLEMREMRIRQHEKLIVAMMLELKLIERVHDDISVMFQEAQANHTKRSSQNELSKQSKTPSRTIFLSNRQELNKIKRQLANELAEHLSILTLPRTYKKYCYNAYKVQTIIGSFSLDFKHFLYRVDGKDVFKTESINDYKGFTVGRNSKNFKKYLKKGEQPDNHISFSLIFHNRTLDLETDTPHARNIVTAALKEFEKYL